MNQHLKLFLGATFQITLVAMNIRQVADKHYFGAFVVSNLVGLSVAFNVKRLSGSPSSFTAFVYALGGGCGTLLGILITKLIYGN